MNRVISFIRDQHSFILKVLFFCLSVGLIVFIFPREGKFKYEFQKGKPWQHVDLIAPFDFPIYKSEEEIKSERKVVKRQMKPYFFKSGRIESEELERFSIEFEKAWSNAIVNLELDENKALKRKSEYFSKGKALLESIYKQGIIEIHTSIEGEDQDFEVAVVQDNVEVVKALSSFYTLKSAFQFINTSIEKTDELGQRVLGNSLENCLKRNVSYDEETNEFVLKQELENISPTLGMIQKGERVASKGDVLTEEQYKIIDSLRTEFESQLGESSNLTLILLGQAVLVALLILSLGLFLYSFRKEIINSDTKIVFLLFLIVLFVFGAKMFLSIENINLYLLPFCVLPIVVRTFFDIRVALFTFLVTILIIGFIAPNPYEFIIIQMITGMLTLLGIVNLRNRSQLFISSLVVFSVYSVVYLSIGLIQEGSFQATNWEFLGWFFGSAMLTLFAYPLIYMFEKIFGFVSDVTLMELADTNNNLLRQLNMKAPGTFQHSLQVSNLAEEAIRAIGGNTLLMRTGALYHDIGKMNMPNYFIENQNSDYNPHGELAPEESAAIIIEHVINGIELAKKNKLPDVIIDFIRTHHGTTTTRFFYKQYLEDHPDETDAAKLFRYPGPLPYSKETAVLMMADSVEAASRSLPRYDGESIEKLVNNIIDSQVTELQFANADITFRDIREIKKMFKRKLMSIYHVRVEYPD
ncbi:HDIG domain-containing protein [bacterium]|nr:HDIG domain-containing protein [bacterium]